MGCSYEVLALGGFAGLGVVVAFAVDGGDFGAHGAEVHGELAAMMDGMAHAELEEADGGKLEQAAEIDDLDERLAAHLADGGEVFVEGSGVEGGRVGGVFDGVRAGPGPRVESAVDDGVVKAIFGGDDVPGKLEGGLGDGIGAVVAFVERDGFDDFFGGAMFVLQGGQEGFVEPEFGLLDGHVFHRWEVLWGGGRAAEKWRGGNYYTFFARVEARGRIAGRPKRTAPTGPGWRRAGDRACDYRWSR